MSDHNFDVQQWREWLRDLQQPNEKAVFEALDGMANKLVKDIVIKRINGMTFQAIGNEYNFSRQYAHQMFWAGIAEIRDSLKGDE